MKKIIKPILITLASLLVLLTITISIALWFIFTPEKISPIINNQAQKIFTCEVEIGNVELTFFSTFPRFALKLDKFTLINPIPGTFSDTLVNVDRLTGVIDIIALWRKNELILSDISVSNGTVNAFVDSTGLSNFDVILTDTTEQEETDFTFDFIDLGNVKLENINLSYVDESLKINTKIQNFYAEIKGTIIEENIKSEAKFNGTYLSYQDDSMELIAGIKNFNGEIKGFMFNDSINSDIKLQGENLSYTDELLKINTGIDNFDVEFIGSITNYENINSVIKLNGINVFFEYDEEIYLHNEKLAMYIPNNIVLSQLSFQLNQAQASINELGFLLNGLIEIDSQNWDINSNINYEFNDWDFENILSLVPLTYHSYLEGIDFNGLISSKGKISGTYSDSLMPLMDIALIVKNGDLNYSDFHLPISNINGDINIYTDLINDEISYLKINRFNAKTPKSSIETKGIFKNLFSDIYAGLTTKVNINLDEFNEMIPDTLNVKMEGMVQGGIVTVFYMSQLEKMQIEKMKLSGSLTAYNIDVAYDSLWVKTDRAGIDFTLPNPESTTKNTQFALATFTCDNFETGKLNDYRTFLQNANIRIETSDLRDTTKIPDLICSFATDAFSANMDSTSIILKNQNGKVSIAPLPDKPDHPEIKLAYNSKGIEANTGEDVITINKIHLDADILNDQSQSDVLLQWLVKGDIDIDKGIITTSLLSHPIEIALLKMDFDSEKLNIKESRMIIDNSDFELSGVLNNVLSYYKGDSILYGDFKFASDNTDILQLMGITSGIGTEKDEDISKNEKTDTQNINDETYTGPYMVPEGINILLSTNIRQATFGNDTARDITGEVSINNGILLLDDLKFTTPAARMQLTSMYRSPRKNHLYLGLDYHMLDIEIEKLLELIPDIDTLMPMLRSFRGKGEFHIAIESYLDSTYNIKKSTLRGASSITGSNLVLLDGETFTEIAKTLRFSKKTENKIDSLSAEFTIFREEIDIYPFLIVMDRYSAVVAGRHNFDYSFDYHITVVDSPVPARFGIDIKGNMEDLKFRPASTRYPEFYRPASRGAVKTSQLDLRKMIRESLTERIHE